LGVERESWVILNINLFFIRKIEMNIFIRNKTQIMTIRTGSIVKLTFPHDARVCIAKVLHIVPRKNPNNGTYEDMSVVKLHYNGYLFIAPRRLLEKPSLQEKRADPKESFYWKNADQRLNLTRVGWVNSVTNAPPLT
jgi:hypothetical protein